MAETETKRATAGAPTWRDFIPDYLPPPRLITRAELLSNLAASGRGVTERTLRFWEAEGVLPRPARQSHEGVVQAVYPDFYPFVVMKVYGHRQENLPLAVIAADIPRAIQALALLSVALENKILPLGDAPHGPEVIEAVGKLVREASEPDRPIRFVRIILTDADGQLAYNLAWPVPVEESPGRADAQLSDGTLSPRTNDS